MNYEPIDGGGTYREAMPDRPSWPVRSLGAASNKSAVNPMGADLGCDRLRSSRKPGSAFLSENLRRLDCCRCAPDRDQGLLPQQLAWPTKLRQTIESPTSPS